MGPGLSAVPEVTEVELTEDDKYLVIGSDGVFDALSNKAIAKIVCKMTGTAQKVRWRVTPGGAPTPPPLPPPPPICRPRRWALIARIGSLIRCALSSLRR